MRFHFTGTYYSVKLSYALVILGEGIESLLGKLIISTGNVFLQTYTNLAMSIM